MMNIAIIGAGASGLAAACELAKYPEHFYVQLFEKNNRIGKKIAATGNGHCNLSNEKMDMAAYQGDIEPLFETIKSFDIEAFCMELGFLTRKKGTLYYPYSEQAKTVVQAFERKIEQSSIQTFLNTEIKQIKKDTNGYRLYDDSNRSFRADAIIVAGGGKASPQLSSDGSCLKLLASMGVPLTPLQPSLVQIKTRPAIKKLKGCRFHGTFCLYENGKKVDERKGEALFNDDGISGIAVMQLSRLLDFEKSNNYILICDMCDEISEDELHVYYSNHKDDDNPYLGIVSEKIANYLNHSKTSNFEDFSHRLHCFQLQVIGTRGFESAQVTRGGVSQEALCDELMLSLYPNIYVCGEILNVDGDCGGYNLHFAFATGKMVASKIANKYHSLILNDNVSYNVTKHKGNED